MRSFLSSLVFLTTLPVRAPEWCETDWQRAPRWYGSVGLIIGALLYGIATLLPFQENLVLMTIIVLTSWIVITGGLHLDGWMDVWDAWGSRAPRERMLEIMRDSRVGAFGVLAFVLLFTWKAVLLYNVLKLGIPFILMLSPFAARTVLMFVMRFIPYARPNGMGHSLGSGVTTASLVLTTTLLAVLTGCFFGIWGVIFGALSVLFVAMFVGQANRSFGGMTGDVYGAVVEWTEVVWLFVFVVAFGGVA
ncbi:MAG: adenosylcobinamide-GDP ribazoletransferase [Bacilli bacterium]